MKFLGFTYDPIEQVMVPTWLLYDIPSSLEEALEDA